MALIAVHAVVNVAAHVGVVEVGCTVTTMAAGALEHAIVTRIRVAGGAHSIRIPMGRREVRVIESRSEPVRRLPRGVTRIASGREAGGGVVRSAG